MKKNAAEKLPTPKPELTYELEGAPPKLFVLYDRRADHWVSSERGLVRDLMHAGTFTEAQAKTIAEPPFAELEIRPLAEVVREQVSGANPVVLQAIAALGGR